MCGICKRKFKSIFKVNLGQGRNCDSRMIYKNKMVTYRNANEILESYNKNLPESVLYMVCYVGSILSPFEFEIDQRFLYYVTKSEAFDNHNAVKICDNCVEENLFHILKIRPHYGYGTHPKVVSRYRGARLEKYIRDSVKLRRMGGEMVDVEEEEEEVMFDREEADYVRQTLKGELFENIKKLQDVVIVTVL